jgi:hypothetical protein
LVVVHILMIICIFAVFVSTLIEIRFRKASVTTISTSVSKSVLQLQARLLQNRERFLHEVGIGLTPGSNGGSATEPAPTLIPTAEKEASSASTTRDAFITAANNALNGSPHPISASCVEALYYVLKMIQDDDDPLELIMTPESRVAISSAHGLSHQLVICPTRYPARPLPLALSHTRTDALGRCLSCLKHVLLCSLNELFSDSGIPRLLPAKFDLKAHDFQA